MILKILFILYTDEVKDDVDDEVTDVVINKVFFSVNDDIVDR